MSKIIIATIAVVTIAVGGYFAFSGGERGDENGAQNGAQNESTSMNSDGKKVAFSEFIKSGGSYMCEVNQSVDGTETTGTVYIDGEKIRGEYNTAVQGLSIDTYLIVLDGNTYTWNSMMPTTGFKSEVSADAEGDGSAGTSGDYSFNADQIGDYDCQPWTVDNTKFTLPVGVTFQQI